MPRKKAQPALAAVDLEDSSDVKALTPDEEYQLAYAHDALVKAWKFRAESIHKRFIDIDKAKDKILKSSFITPISPVTDDIVKMFRAYGYNFVEIADRLEQFAKENADNGDN